MATLIHSTEVYLTSLRKNDDTQFLIKDHLGKGQFFKVPQAYNNNKNESLKRLSAINSTLGQLDKDDMSFITSK